MRLFTLAIIYRILLSALFILLANYSFGAKSFKVYAVTHLNFKSGIVNGCRPPDSALVMNVTAQLVKYKKRQTVVKSTDDLTVRFQVINRNGKIGRPKISALDWRKKGKKGSASAEFPISILRTDDTAILAELFYKNILLWSKSSSFTTCIKDTTPPPKPCDYTITIVGAPEVMSPTPQVDQFIYGQEYRVTFRLSTGDTINACKLIALIDAFSGDEIVNTLIDRRYGDNRFAVGVNPDTVVFDYQYQFQLPQKSGLKELWFRVTLKYFYSDTNQPYVSEARSKTYTMQEHLNCLNLY